MDVSEQVNVESGCDMANLGCYSFRFSGKVGPVGVGMLVERHVGFVVGGRTAFVGRDMPSGGSL